MLLTGARDTRDAAVTRLNSKPLCLSAADEALFRIARLVQCRQGAVAIRVVDFSLHFGARRRARMIPPLIVIRTSVTNAAARESRRADEQRKCETCKEIALQDSLLSILFAALSGSAATG